jgi:hypothetical protein
LYFFSVMQYRRAVSRKLVKPVRMRRAAKAKNLTAGKRGPRKNARAGSGARATSSMSALQLAKLRERCECGGLLSEGDEKNHTKSARHLDWMTFCQMRISTFEGDMERWGLKDGCGGRFVTMDKHHNMRGSVLNSSELKDDDDEVFGCPDHEQEMEEGFGVVHLPPVGWSGNERVPPAGLEAIINSTGSGHAGMAGEFVGSNESGVAGDVGGDARGMAGVVGREKSAGAVQDGRAGPVSMGNSSGNESMTTRPEVNAWYESQGHGMRNGTFVSMGNGTGIWVTLGTGSGSGIDGAMWSAQNGGRGLWDAKDGTRVFNNGTAILPNGTVLTGGLRDLNGVARSEGAGGPNASSVICGAFKAKNGDIFFGCRMCRYITNWSQNMKRHVSSRGHALNVRLCYAEEFDLEVGFL